MFGDLNQSNNKVLLGDLCRHITDGSHNPPQSIDVSDYLMLSSKNIVDGTISLDSPRYLSYADFFNENKRTQVTPGDVLMTIVGTVGRTAVVPNDFPSITLQRSVAVLKPKDGINSIFLSKMLDMMSSEIEMSAHGVAQKGIYLSQVKNLRVIKPSNKLQERFAAFVSQVDKSKFAIQKAIDKLELLKASLMQEYFG